jgi:hypothetical protein
MGSSVVATPSPSLIQADLPAADRLSQRQAIPMLLVPRVYADFNAIEYPVKGGSIAEIPLTGYGTLASLSRQSLRLIEGMKMVLYEPNDIECEGVAHFDRTRTDPAGRHGEWVARINHRLTKDNLTEKDEPKTHPCLDCAIELSTVFKGHERSYTEHCPACGTSVMASMQPPDNAD